MRKRIAVFTVFAVFAAASVAIADQEFFTVRPGTFDPAKTYLVAADWIKGIGCPTNAKTFDGTTTSSYTDPACPTGDPRDQTNQGLLLSKEGPTANYASAGATLQGVRGQALTELGYDIRKPDLPSGPRGSHCGAGAPRFNITLQDGSSYFLGCNSPPATTVTSGQAWQRLRWGGNVPLLAYSAAPPGALTDITGKTVRSIEIVYDEGSDTGPDNFGMAILDNVDVNGKLVGRGPRGNDGDDDDGGGGSALQAH